MTDKVMTNEEYQKLPLVIIGVATHGGVAWEFAQCLWGTGRGARNHRQGLVVGASSIVANARNNTVEGAIGLKGDYIFFVDTDMVFPPNSIDRLLAHGKDIVGATYVRRGPPFDTLGKTKNEFDGLKASGLVEMTHMPTGCLLIKLEVFRKMQKPYFRFGVNEKEGVIDGEDMTFSKMVRELGYTMWNDCDLSKDLGHLYTTPLNVQDPALRKIAEEFKAKQKPKLIVNG